MERFEIREGFSYTKQEFGGFVGVTNVTKSYTVGDIVYAELVTDKTPAFPENMEFVAAPEGITGGDWYYIPDGGVVVNSYYLFPYPETTVTQSKSTGATIGIFVLLAIAVYGYSRS